MWLPPNLHMKARWCEMLGIYQLLILSLYGNIALAIISLILTIVLIVKIIKENHTSANQ